MQGGTGKPASFVYILQAYDGETFLLQLYRALCVPHLYSTLPHHPLIDRWLRPHPPALCQGTAMHPGIEKLWAAEAIFFCIA
ncbi:UNVERIFIED_CONTAM: hypothetical protein FKN15_011135 [Acipenser sinensis]